MSELFSKEQKDALYQSNVMKDDFGWEVPIESVPLPSRGLIYSPDSMLYNRETLQIRSMTAREEDILSSQALIKEGKVLEWLISSCLIDKGINVNEMIAGDRNALMVSIRITGYGPEYNISSSCQFCDHTNKVCVDLSGLEIKRIGIEPIEQGRNQFYFRLPVTGKDVVFKYLSLEDDKERKAKNKFAKNVANFEIENNVTSFLEASIISINNISDKNKIAHFIRNMPANDSRKLRSFIKNNEPGIKMEHEYECSNCSQKNSISLPITSEFFWPDT